MWCAIEYVYLQGHQPSICPVRLTHVRVRCAAQFPCLLLMWFGCWSLASISIGLLTVQDCPEAAASLQKEITEARADLARRGMKDL